MNVDDQFMRVFPIGLGCSRLGSILGASSKDSAQLIRSTYDAGIRFYDTSDIYGQGESERLLGRALRGRDDIIVCTKVGKHLPAGKRALLPLKSLIRRFAGVSGSISGGIKLARAKPMLTCWEPRYLTSAVDCSLRRLGRERLDVLMLHSPPAGVIAAGEAVGALEAAQQAGKIGWIGISVDDVAAGEAALADPRVRALQVPLHPNRTDFDTLLGRASALGVTVVAREVLGGPEAIGAGPLSREIVVDRIRQAVARPGVSVTIVGTTKAAHMLDCVRAIM